MLTASAKAKGRRACQEMQKLILEHFPELTSDDVRVTPSGVPGEDLQLSTRAREVFPFVVECKNTEKLNVWKALAQARTRAGTPLLAIKRNREVLYVVIEAKKFIELLKGEKKC
jgi:hypothetical protein